MELTIMESGLRTSNMARAMRSGQMAHSTRVNTVMERSMDQERWLLLMALSTKESSKTMRSVE
jgi:hypothetical protein